MKKMCYIGLIAIIVSIFSGCSTFSGIKLGYDPEPHEKIISSHVIKSDVRDERSYVKNGSKKDSYLGHYRGGYGNVWDIHLKKKESLAKQFAIDILKELKACGFQTSPLSGDRALKVDIMEYNFDAYIDGRFWYEIQVSVLDSTGTVLTSDTVKGEHIIKGSVLTGPALSFEKELPEIYHGIIEKIVRDNNTVLKALK